MEIEIYVPLLFVINGHNLSRHHILEAVDFF